MSRSRSGGPPAQPLRSADGPGLLADPRDEDDDDSMLPPSHRPAPEPLPENERPFGRYTLLRRLAYGGMGEVFLARQGGAGSLAPVSKLVVIKRILGHMKRDEKHRQMFLGEAQLQALLQNPHIVAIYDMGEEGGHVYLAMEHVHGPSWRLVIDRCRRRREYVPLAHVCSMVAQAARGLSYAHNLVDVTGHPLRIVHRDINPHNVLVSYDAQVKLIDFGIAKSELQAGHTETGTIKGKFNYMSPEQSAAEPLDQRSDLFALGICLWELVANQNPFRRANAVLSLEAIQKDMPPPIARKRPEAAPLQDLIDRCLAKDRNDRVTDASEIAAELDELVASGAVAPPSEPLPTWLRERFAEEIAEHVQILEETGSQNALAMRRGSDPSAVPRSRNTGSFAPAGDPQTSGPIRAARTGPNAAAPSSGTGSGRVGSSKQPVSPNAPTTVGPLEATRNERRPESLDRQLPTAAPEWDDGSVFSASQQHAHATMEAPAFEQTSTTPPPAPTFGAATPMPLQPQREQSRSMSVSQVQQRRSPALGAALGVLLVVAAGLAAFLAYRVFVVGLDKQPDPELLAAQQRLQELQQQHDQLQQQHGSGADTTNANGADSQQAQNTSAQNVNAQNAQNQVDAGVATNAEAVVDPVDPGAPLTGKKKKANPKKEKEPIDLNAGKETFAIVGVRTEGYAVKGSRKLPKGGSTVLVVGGDGQAPFSVRIKVTQDGEGAKFSVDSDPWSIIVVGGVGKGKTPQAFTLAKGGSTTVKLSNPKAAPMELGLSLP